MDEQLIILEQKQMTHQNLVQVQYQQCLFVYVIPMYWIH